MTAKVDIMNLAITELEETLIASPGDATESARVVNAVYDDVLKWVLEDYDWSFARKRSAISPDAIKPVYEWDNRFLFPVDLVKLRSVEDNIDYSIEDGAIVANTSSLKIKYTFMQTDTTKYSGQFNKYFSYELAIKCAGRLTGKTEIRNRLIKDLLGIRKNAVGQDVLESNTQPNMSPTLWINSRTVGVNNLPFRKFV